MSPRLRRIKKHDELCNALLVRAIVDFESPVLPSLDEFVGGEDDNVKSIVFHDFVGDTYRSAIRDERERMNGFTLA